MTPWHDGEVAHARQILYGLVTCARSTRSREITATPQGSDTISYSRTAGALPRSNHRRTAPEDGARLPVRSMIQPAHILFVEDDSDIRSLVAEVLGTGGFRVSVARDGREMDRVLQRTRIDLILLDIMLPGEDGLSLCRRIRASGAVPVIMLTARGSEIERVIGLEMGADDYLTKPFSSHELLARIRAVLRRTQALSPNPSAGRAVTLTFAGWALNLAARRLQSPDGTRIPLTGAEFDLLVAFCERPNRVLSREQLLDLTRGRTASPLDRSIDIQISRLRRKIEENPRLPALIQTVRAEGYVFTAEVQST